MGDRAGTQAPACPICERNRVAECPFEAAHLRVSPPRRIWRCTDCTHVFLDPPCSAEELARLYTADYYAAFEAGAGMAGEKDGGVAPHLCRRLAHAESQLKGRRLLDLGCGKGSFLAHAQGRGWAVLGADVSADAVAFVRQRRGLAAECGEIEGLVLPREEFHFIHANHVLEHVNRPLAALRRINTWLQRDGLFVVEVPNEFDNLFFLLGRRLLPRSRMIRRKPSPHVQFFTPASLRFALEATGFVVCVLDTRRWQVGTGSQLAVRMMKRGVAAVERMLNRGGAIVAVARRGLSRPSSEPAATSRAPA